MTTGVHGEISWIEADMSMGDLLAACPEIVLGRFVAITSADSGCTALPKEFGAMVNGLEDLRSTLFSGGCCDGHFMMPEAYVFDGPVALPPVCHGNVFELGVGPERVFPFVTFLGFRLSDPAMRDITGLLWTQMEWMRPKAYIAAADGRAYFATADRALFAAVREALRGR